MNYFIATKKIEWVKPKNIFYVMVKPSLLNTPNYCVTIQGWNVKLELRAIYLELGVRSAHGIGLHVFLLYKRQSMASNWILAMNYYSNICINGGCYSNYWYIYILYIHIRYIQIYFIHRYLNIDRYMSLLIHIPTFTADPPAHLRVVPWSLPSATASHARPPPSYE
jgi:hypothetical protein